MIHNYAWKRPIFWHVCKVESTFLWSNRTCRKRTPSFCLVMRVDFDPSIWGGISRRGEHETEDGSKKLHVIVEIRERDPVRMHCVKDNIPRSLSIEFYVTIFDTFLKWLRRLRRSGKGTRSQLQFEEPWPGGLQGASNTFMLIYVHTHIHAHIHIHICLHTQYEISTLTSSSLC